jgi:hypothetical protein
LPFTGGKLSTDEEALIDAIVSESSLPEKGGEGHVSRLHYKSLGPINHTWELAMRDFIPIFIVSFILILCPTTSAQFSKDVVQLFEAVGARAGSQLGYQVAGLGDQNGDGYNDILASAPGDRRAFLYFGGNPMDTIPDVVFQKESEDGFGYCLCNLGDVNGDTDTDFAIGSKNIVRVYWGGAVLDTLADLILPGAAFRDVCAAGDVNGDGYNDILMSQVTWQSHQGKATI